MAVTVDGRWVKRALRKRAGSPYWHGAVRDLRSGRTYFKSTNEKSKRRAEQAILDFIKELKAKEAEVPVQGPDFAATFRQWLDLKTLRESTRIDYEATLSGIFAPYFQGMLVSDVEPIHIEKFLKHLETARSSSAKTKRKHLTTLRSFFQWAIRHKHCKEDPTQGIRAPRGAKRQGVALTIEEARRLLAACRKPKVLHVKDGRRPEGWNQSWTPPNHIGLAIHIALLTGLRRANVLNLTWGQIDLDKRTIRIDAAEMKAQSDLVIPIHHELVAVFAREVGRHRKPPSKSDRVLGGELKEITSGYRSALKRADVPKVRWHDLRHTFATWMSTRCTFAALRQLIGHSAGNVTLSYSHIPVDELRQAVDTLPGLLSASDSKQAEETASALPARRGPRR